MSHGNAQNGVTTTADGAGENGEATVVIEGPEEKRRGAWDSKLTYFFMVISYAVGLGNVWRFPYLTQTHGGGAFLVPYLIFLFILGMPILYLELSIGQRLRLGCVGVWSEIHPLLGGLGIASAVTSFVVAIYYNAVIMWCFFYLFHSFTDTLPWASCPTITVDNKTVPVEECQIGGPTSYYWYREALDISSDLAESGGVKWKMLLCHVFSWLVIYLCICKSIKSSGKVVYFTATFPYVVLLIFFIRGITLEGAVDGLLHMLTPKMDQLLDVHCWLDAAAQIFFSFGLAFGGLIAFSSYNPLRNNVERDTVIIGITNWCTAIFACAVIFTVIGFKATVMYNYCVDQNIDILGEICSNINFTDTLCYGHNSSETITRGVYKDKFEDNLTAFTNLTTRNFRKCDLEEDLTEGVGGTGLAFIIFTQAINEFGPSAPFWSIVFFLMLLSLGLGSEFGTIEGVTTSLYDLDLFPWMKKKWLVSGMLCLTCCVVGLVFTLGSGSYWLAVFDAFAGTFPLILIALCECMAVGWVLGVNRFGEEIKYMIGHQPNIFWKISWKFTAPVLIVSLLLGIFVMTFSRPITYQVYNPVTTFMVDTPYPWYASLLCVALVLIAIIWIPGVAVLRKFGVLQYSHRKVLARHSDTSSSSPVKFLGRKTLQRSDDKGFEEESLTKNSEKPADIFSEDISNGAGHHQQTNGDSRV